MRERELSQQKNATLLRTFASFLGALFLWVQRVSTYFSTHKFIYYHKEIMSIKKSSCVHVKNLGNHDFKIFNDTPVRVSVESSFQVAMRIAAFHLNPLYFT